MKPNAAGGSVGESDRPTWGLSLGPGDGGDYSLVSRQPQGEGREKD